MNNVINTYKLNSLNSPLSSKDCFMLVLLTKGVLQVTLLGESYELYGNDGVVIFPNQPHSFITYEDVNVTVVEFSSSLLPDLLKLTANKECVNPIISFNKVQDYIEDLFDCHDIFLIKSNLYYIFSYFLSKVTLKEIDNKTQSIINDVISYIENNYFNEISLHTLAKHLQYDYNYTSRLIKINFKCSFPVIVNLYRIEKASQMLINEKDKTISEIAYSCGFNSIRTFNRVFYQEFSCSPRDWKEKYR